MSWDKLYTILFNPNHEFSLQTFIIIVIICLLVPNLAKWMIYRRQLKNDVSRTTITENKPTYHTPKKKKRSKKK